jgi:hypothetical protein
MEVRPREWPIQHYKHFRSFRGIDEDLPDTTLLFLVPKWRRGRGGKKTYKSFRLLLQGGDSLYVEFNAGDILQDRIFKGSSHHII